MTQIAVQPHVLKDVILSIGVDAYEKHVSQAELRPSTKVEKLTWQGMTPAAKFSEAGTPETSWDLIISYAQDWETPNSLSQYLLTNSGQTKTVVLQPKRGAGGKTFTVDVTIVPGPVGGNVNTVAVGSVTMPCDGDPVPGAAA
jgi:hypothetical protein